jgi:hypothetical protein
MTLISLVVTLVIVGLLLWALTLLPIDPKIRQIINVVVIVVVLLYLLTLFLPSGGILNARIGH